MAISAIIFDLDGVILESGDIKTQAFLELFAAYPEHRDAILAYHLANLGISRYDKFEWIYRECLGMPLSAEERARLGRVFSELVLEQVLTCPFVPGALQALESLHDSTLLFVASGTPQAELNLILERRGIARCFKEAWGSPHEKTEVVQCVLERYALPPSEVLFVGDGSSDYEAAKATGIHFVARDTPEMAEQWRTLNVPRIADLTELEDFLVPSAKLQLVAI